MQIFSIHPTLHADAISCFAYISHISKRRAHTCGPAYVQSISKSYKNWIYTNWIHPIVVVALCETPQWFRRRRRLENIQSVGSPKLKKKSHEHKLEKQLSISRL
ncbi:hypothetical protein AAMO2058_001447200 [Amorphochlora amoebiformis]